MILKNSYTTVVAALIGILFIISYIIHPFMYVIPSETLDILHYITVIFCFALTFYPEETLSHKDKWLVRCALGLSLVADYFFIFPINYLNGVIVFMIVHSLHIYRHIELSNDISLRRFSIFLAISLIITGSISMFLPTPFDSLTIAGIIYANILLMSLFTSINIIPTLKDKYYNAYIIPLGIFFFVLCDINVALHYFLESDLTFYLFWFFYIISQSLLGISVISFKN